MSVPSGYSTETKICWGSLSGKNSILGGKIPIKKIEKINIPKVPEINIYGLIPDNAYAKNFE